MSTTNIGVIAWPEGWAEHDRVLALAATLGQDPSDARMAARKEPPAIVQRMDARDAAECLRALRGHGVRCFGATDTQIESMPAPRLARRLVAGEGRYTAELWRESSPVTFRAMDVALIVRAKIRTQTRSVQPESGSSIMMSTEIGAVSALHDYASGMSPRRTSSVRTSDLLDLHLMRGPSHARLRINGDKFNFDILGALKGFSDHENIEKLAMKLLADAPEALVDTGFARFGMEIRSTQRASVVGTKITRTRSNASPFEFYSAWCWLLHRAIMDGA